MAASDCWVPDAAIYFDTLAATIQAGGSRVRDTTAVREQTGSESLAGPSLRHDLKTPLAAVRAATAQLQKNLRDLLASVEPRGESSTGGLDLLRFLATSLATPRTHVPATGLDRLRRTDRLTARLAEAGVGEHCSEAARIILRGGWEEDLDELIPFLLTPAAGRLLGLLDAVGRLRSNLASLEASGELLEALAAGPRPQGEEPARSMAEFGVEEALHAALATVQHQAAPSVAIETDCPEGLRLVGIRTRFQQVVVNLVANALSVVPATGGKIGVHAREAGEDVLLRVEDNGSGVPDEMREILFTPFATSRPGTGGTGLGLFLAHRIVEEHGGTLRHVAQEGKTVFEARFPRGGPRAGS